MNSYTRTASVLRYRRPLSGDWSHLLVAAMGGVLLASGIIEKCMNKHFRQFVRLMLRLASNLLESTTNRRVGGRGRWSIRGAGLNVTLLRAAAALALGLEVVAPSQAAEGFVQIRNGYLWDPVSGDYFIPRGVAYQIWNPPVGANQSLEQVDYDLLEFKKLRANSVRAEMTWGQVQIGPDQYGLDQAGPPDSAG